MSNKGVRNEYANIGVEKYYEIHNSDYRNPHEYVIKRLIHFAEESGLIGYEVLDLCCGSGEVTCALQNCKVTGVDPYTSAAYYNRTGQKAIPLAFMDIAKGKLSGNFDSILCSFALHLCPVSLLPMVLWNLGNVSSTLIVISPHKRPDCDKVSGWVLVEEELIDRVRMKIYCR